MYATHRDQITAAVLFLLECSQASGMRFAWYVVLPGKSFIDLYDTMCASKHSMGWCLEIWEPSECTRGVWMPPKYDISMPASKGGYPWAWMFPILFLYM